MPLSVNKLKQIIEHYSTEELTPLNSYENQGTEPLWGRFERAALNQIHDGDATISRYAIWANTVRDNIHEGMRCMKEGNLEEAENYQSHCCPILENKGSD